MNQQFNPHQESVFNWNEVIEEMDVNDIILLMRNASRPPVEAYEAIAARCRAELGFMKNATNCPPQIQKNWNFALALAMTFLQTVNSSPVRTE